MTLEVKKKDVPDGFRKWYSLLLRLEKKWNKKVVAGCKKCERYYPRRKIIHVCLSCGVRTSYYQEDNLKDFKDWERFKIE